MMPLEYVKIALVLSLLTLSVFVITRHGMVFYAIRCLIESIIETSIEMFFNDKTKGKAASKIVLKPLFLCPPCMASIWGTTFYWWVFAGGIKEWIVCVLLCSILNKIIYPYVEQ